MGVIYVYDFLRDLIHNTKNYAFVCLFDKEKDRVYGLDGLFEEDIVGLKKVCVANSRQHVVVDYVCIGDTSYMVLHMNRATTGRTLQNLRYLLDNLGEELYRLGLGVYVSKDLGSVFGVSGSNFALLLQEYFRDEDVYLFEEG